LNRTENNGTLRKNIKKVEKKNIPQGIVCSMVTNDTYGHDDQIESENQLN
jgi:hypothetical protein